MRRRLPIDCVIGGVGQRAHERGVLIMCSGVSKLRQRVRQTQHGILPALCAGMQPVRSDLPRHGVGAKSLSHARTTVVRPTVFLAQIMRTLNSNYPMCCASIPVVRAAIFGASYGVDDQAYLLKDGPCAQRVLTPTPTPTPALTPTTASHAIS